MLPPDLTIQFCGMTLPSPVARFGTGRIGLAIGLATGGPFGQGLADEARRGRPEIAGEIAAQALSEPSRIGWRAWIGRRMAWIIVHGGRIGGRENVGNGA